MAEKNQKLFADQFDDENVLFVFRKHPVVMRKGLILAALGILIGPLYTLALTYVRPDNVPSLNFFYLSTLGSLLLGTVLFSPSLLSWYYSLFIVTDQRLIQITQKGLFHRSVVDISLSQIQMVNYEIAGLQETLLGFGTLMMQTYVGDLIIHDVHHPAKIQKKFQNILRDQGAAASVHPANKDTDQDEED